MAKSINDFKGWQLVLDVSEPLSPAGPASPATPSRRSSRYSKTVDTGKIVLKRMSDGLELKDGDCVVIRHDPEDEQTDICYIKEIKFAGDVYIEIIITWFVRVDETEFESIKPKDEQLSEQELFLTAYLDVIQLNTLVGHAKVYSQKEFEDLALDSVDKETTFFCRKCCDFTGEKFSSDIDWRELHKLGLTDPNLFINTIRELTIPSVKKFRESATPTPKKARKIQSKAPTIREKLEYGSDNNNEQDNLSGSDFSFDEDDDEDDDDEDDYDEDDDYEDPLERRIRRKRRGFSKDKSLKKSKNSILPNLPDRSLPHTDSSFKEAKAKLHTSSRLNSLPCREDEFAEIYMNLESAISSEVGCCLYVSGTPGVGKTATVREVINQLKDIADTGDLQSFDYTEINGLKLITPHAAYEALWERISGNRISASDSLSRLEKFFQEDRTDKKPLVVLMDELDQIVTKNQNVMYNFFNWPTYEFSKLIVIAVANTMDLPERILTNKISSRLGLRRIQFVGYTYQQLGVIIKHRLDSIEKNRKSLVIKEDAIEFAARKVAAVSGDARRALTICRRAVEISEQDFLESQREKQTKGKEDEKYYVTIPHISKAINETTNSPMATYLKLLPFATKLFLFSLLLRKKRSGLAENSLGDILDEMRRTLTMYSAKNQKHNNNNFNLMETLYGDNNLRIYKFKFIVNELIESGLLLQQNVSSERYALVNLNLSEDEIFSVLRRDKEIEGML